ncbi:MAG: hypothetical protein LBT32_07970 [Peptococcaceae bacterium]|jgi:hypothetical protein|nr:hypothetical protein [Peptococcaceae bacterium]
MQVEKRRSLRTSLLTELYLYHFANTGLPKQLDIRTIEADPERHLAYHYLMERDFVRVKHYDRVLSDFKITAFGIDVVEKNEV